MYKREAMEYDTDYIKKYNEDLNTTLIFVSNYRWLSQPISFVVVGGSILCRQLSIRHRCPFSTPARPKRAIRGPPPCHPPHSQSVCDSRRDPCRSTHSERPTERGRHSHRPHVRKPSDLPARRIRRHAGKAMAQPVLA